MTYNRSSMLVKLGRGFQNGYKYMSFLDVLAVAPLLFKKSASCPVICIVAPPRSGSTLSYQVITTLIENLHLTNIWNLLYSTPIMACSISNALCKSYNAKFKSDNGFVQGICGESEGMRFWEYWSGQGLIEDPGGIDEKQLQKLYRAMSKISDGKVFVTGYIGHAFCMNSLRKAFPEIIFVHVTRDLLSNAYSIYERSIKGWFSLLTAKA